MARPRKSTVEHELNGSFKKDPKRGKAREHQPPSNGPVGEPPNYFDDHQRDLWREVVETVPPKVLAKADRLVIEVISRLLEKLREGTIRGAELNILISCLSRLGLTPADRSRVAIATEKDESGQEDDFANFVAQHTGPGGSNRAN